MGSRATSRNLFGFGKKVTVHKHHGSSRRDISRLAFSAGQKSGDTGLFSSWADSKHLKDHWDSGALREFEKAYRDGVEKGETIEKAKEESKNVSADVIEALVGQGMSRSQAKASVKSHHKSGDSFDDLWRRITAKNPSYANPESPAKLQASGWKLVDKYRTRDTAAEIREKWQPSRLIYRSGQWEVWTRQHSSSNPFEQVPVGEFAKRFGTMREGTISIQKPRLELIRREQKRYGGDIFEVVDSRGRRVAYALVVRRASNPAKFDRCVAAVSKSLKASGRPGNAYAICTAAETRNPKVATLRQGRATARVFREGLLGKKFRAEISAPGVPAVSDSFGSLQGAMGWARLHLHEMAHNPALVKGRKNPLAQAEKVYEEFHGMPSTEVIEYRETEHYHSVVVGTGKLICLDVLTVDGKEIPLIAPGYRFEPARFLRRDLRHSEEARRADATWIFDSTTPISSVIQVTFSEDRKQMLFTGGDQSLPLETLGLTDRDQRDNMFIGSIVEITYRTRKKFEQGGKEEVDFHHEYGKQGSRGVLPLLGYFLRTKRMFTLGGRYEIAPVRSDIGASPGIVG